MTGKDNEFVWKRDVANFVNSNRTDILVLIDKIYKAAELYDEPQDFFDSLSKIRGKTDSGVAFMEIFSTYVQQQMENAPADDYEEPEPEPEPKPKKKKSSKTEDEDEDEDDEDDE